jgi:hypothetical protein
MRIPKLDIFRDPARERLLGWNDASLLIIVLLPAFHASRNQSTIGSSYIVILAGLACSNVVGATMESSLFVFYEAFGCTNIAAIYNGRGRRYNH